MSDFSDYRDEMPSRERLDDATADAVLAGRPPVDRDDLADLTAFVDEVRHTAHAESPEPSEALAAVFVEGLGAVGGQELAPSVQPPTPPATTRERWVPSGAGHLARLLSGVGTRIAIAMAALVVAVLGAGLGGVLPQPANELVARAVETVTPFRVTDDAGTGADGQATESGDSDQPGTGGPRTDDPDAGGPDADGGRGAGGEAAGHAERGGDVLDGWMGRSRVDGRPEFPGHHGSEREADTPAGERVPGEPGPPDGPGSGPPPDPGQGTGTPPSGPGQQPPGQGRAPRPGGSNAGGPGAAGDAGTINDPGTTGDPGTADDRRPADTSPEQPRSRQSDGAPQSPGSGESRGDAESMGEAGGAHSGSGNAQPAPGGHVDDGGTDPGASDETGGPLDRLPQPSSEVGGAADAAR